MMRVTSDQVQFKSEILKPGNLSLGKLKLGQSKLGQLNSDHLNDKLFHIESSQNIQIQPKPIKREIYDL